MSTAGTAPIDLFTRGGFPPIPRRTTATFWSPSRLQEVPYFAIRIVRTRAASIPYCRRKAQEGGIPFRRRAKWTDWRPWNCSCASWTPARSRRWPGMNASDSRRSPRLSPSSKNGWGSACYCGRHAACRLPRPAGSSTSAPSGRSRRRTRRCGRRAAAGAASPASCACRPRSASESSTSFRGCRPSLTSIPTWRSSWCSTTATSTSSTKASTSRCGWGRCRIRA